MGSWSWRRKQVDTYSQEHIPGAKFHNREPPQDNGQFSVPSWEKKFCMSVSSVPWRKLVETKKCMYLYDSIIQWNDSANEEAFKNAKDRFWAKINGLPSNISLPDPDIYIDDIDWNSTIDPELILDLEREHKPSNYETQDEAVILGDPFLLPQTFSCTRWGEDEEDFNHKGNPENWDCGWNTDNKENLWEPVSAQTKAPIGGWNNSWNPWENNLAEWENKIHDSKNMNYARAQGGFWRKSDANSRKKDGGSWYNSKYKTSGFHGDYYQKDYYQKDRGWRKAGRWNNRVHAGFEDLA